MPALPRHDEGVPWLDHGVFGRTAVIDGDQEASFENAEDFVARGMAFPVVGMDRIIVTEVYDPEGAVVFRCSTSIEGPRNPQSPPGVIV